MSRNLSLNALWNDTDGIILPYVTILLVVIVGVSVLALDGGRYLSLQTQLQNGADQLAIAASAELNGAPDSITRA
jgi:Flp pilus assembly protein TadG